MLRKRLSRLVGYFAGFTVAENFDVAIVAPVDETENVIPSFSGPEIGVAFRHIAHDLRALVAIEEAGLKVSLSDGCKGC